MGVWDGNEVWLLAAGGTIFFAFPVLYASAFSGFYLALMIVLWLLILRGISIEFRNRSSNPLWRPLWDTGFAAASATLAVVFGVALGNVVRGVPLDSNGYFFLPLWTNLVPGKPAGIIDWYTLLVGAASLLALANAWRPLGCHKDGGDVTGANALVCRKVLGGFRRFHAADFNR
jgi:cytochrome bd ubiquinol oxidase subunit II